MSTHFSDFRSPMPPPVPHGPPGPPGSPCRLILPFAIFGYPSCVILISFKTKSADVILKMTMILKEMRIAQLGS